MSSGGRTGQVTSSRIAWLNVNDEDMRAKTEISFEVMIRLFQCLAL